MYKKPDSKTCTNCGKLLINIPMTCISPNKPFVPPMVPSPFIPSIEPSFAPDLGEKFCSPECAYQYTQTEMKECMICHQNFRGLCCPKCDYKFA